MSHPADRLAGDPEPREWIRVADPDLAPGTITEAVIGDTDLVIWRTQGGTACVMDARCPHQWSHLGAEGAVDGEEIICCSHWWRFSTSGTGSMLRSNGTREPTAPIGVYPCVETGNGIWIEPLGT